MLTRVSVSGNADEEQPGTGNNNKVCHLRGIEA